EKVVDVTTIIQRTRRTRTLPNRFLALILALVPSDRKGENGPFGKGSTSLFSLAVCTPVVPGVARQRNVTRTFPVSFAIGSTSGVCSVAIASQNRPSAD